MSQSASHPHHISNLLEPALIEIVHALSDRANLTTAEYEARADATWALVESFQPRDVIDLLLSGQLIAFNAVFANATRGLLDGMEDTLKKQTMSSLVSMARVTQGHVDRLAKRGNQPYRTEIVAPLPAARPDPVTKSPSAATPPPAAPLVASPETAPQPAPRPVPEPAPGLATLVTPLVAHFVTPLVAPAPAPHSATPPARQPRTPEPAPPAGEPPVAETSRVDPPHQESLIEIPGRLSDQERTARTAAVLELMRATRGGNGAGTPPADVIAEPHAAETSDPDDRAQGKSSRLT